MIYFKLFRLPNLLIIALTQYLFRYCIIIPILQKYNIDFFFTDFEFFLLVLATLFVAAAGYSINDYFDLRIDRINKPHKIILGKEISRRKAIFFHTVFNFIAFIIGLYLSYRANYWFLSSMFIIVPLLLWMYSTRYKRKFLIGNIIIAAISAIVIAVVWIFECRGLMLDTQIDKEKLDNAIVNINQLFRAYLIFAFLITFIREIIKDIEDIKGDLKTGCKTIPVTLGIRKSKNIIVAFSVLLVFFVVYFQFFYLLGIEYNLIFAYLLFAVQIPLILLINKISKAKEKQDFSISSRLVKLITVTGVFSMFLFYYYL